MNIVPILWNTETEELESEDGFIESLGIDEADGKEHLKGYIIHRLAEYFNTYTWLIKTIKDTAEFLTIEIEDTEIEWIFQKNLLPKLLNETIFLTHKFINS